MSMLEKILEWFPEDEFLKADGFDDAIIGVDNQSYRLIYSISACIKVLMDEGMSEEDAHEYLNFNVMTAWVGEKTPIFCIDDL